MFPSVIAAAASVNAHLTGLDGGHATQGFFWRLQGSTATYDPTTKRRKCVEQLSLDTGEVLQVFPSKAAAAASVKIGTCPFSEMSMDKGKVTQGFFWRLQGSTATPATHIAKTLCGRKAVEKISLETGAVLRVFPSKKDAAASVGLSGSSLDLRSMDKKIATQGFF